MLLDVYDLQIIAAFELLLADPPQVRDRRSGTRAGTRYKQPKQVLGQVSSSKMRNATSPRTSRDRSLGAVVALPEP